MADIQERSPKVIDNCRECGPTRTFGPSITGLIRLPGSPGDLRPHYEELTIPAPAEGPPTQVFGGGGLARRHPPPPSLAPTSVTMRRYGGFILH